MPVVPTGSSDGLEPGSNRVASRVPLSRDRVLTAALCVVDAEGFGALTMRRLGRELDCHPMALYRYAPNRAALLDGVVELVLDQLEAPDGDQPWQTQLRGSAHAFRRLALTHPDVVPLLVTRPPATPLGLRALGALRPLEHVVGLLVGVGFAPVAALHVYRAYISLLCGHVLAELQEIVADPEETPDLLRIRLRRLPPSEFTHTRGLTDALAHYDGAAELDHAVDLLLTGLHTQLHATTASTRA